MACRGLRAEAGQARAVAYDDFMISRIGNSIRRAILYLLGAFFLTFGSITFRAAFRKFQSGKTAEGIWLGILTVVFYAVAFGLWFSRLSVGDRQKRANDLRAVETPQPWLWREDWASGRIVSLDKGTTLHWLTVAALWNFLSVVWILTAREDILVLSGPTILFVLFSAIGLGLLVWAFLMVARWGKFGESVFIMKSVPGVVGGELSGVIDIPVKLRPQDGFQLKLVCMSQNGPDANDDSISVRAVLWKSEQTMARDLIADDPARTGIPVCFQIPRECRATDETIPGFRVFWRLEASAKLPGVNYQAVFEVPIFATLNRSEMLKD